MAHKVIFLPLLTLTFRQIQMHDESSRVDEHIPSTALLQTPLRCDDTDTYI